MINKYLHRLETGTSFAFHDWPNSLVPKVAIGVYTVWDNKQLLYGGMAGLKLTKELVIKLPKQKIQKPKGLYDRLASHARGGRGSDKFCLYVCDRLILASLTHAEIDQIAKGSLSLDNLTRDYIRKYLSYRFVEVEDPNTARNLENSVKRGELSVGKPFLNPS